MFLLGVLAIVQVVFLPGFLLLQVLKLRANVWRTVLLSFSLSLVLNHLLVALLVLGGCYRSQTIYVVFGLEVVCLLCILPRRSVPTLADLLVSAVDHLQRSLLWVKASVGDKRSQTRTAIAVAAALVTIGFALAAFSQVGQIFSSWDAVVSWNRWAIDWSQNHFPSKTWQYPQLLPSNWSLTYVFIQDSGVWFFAKAIMPLFCLLLLVALLDLATETKELGYVLAVPIVYLILVAVLRFRTLSIGYADVPVAFLSFASVYSLILAQRMTSTSDRTKYIFLGALIAGGAALTKQAGLFIAAVYPVLTWLIAFTGRTPVRVRGRLAAAAMSLTVLSAVILPWYVYKHLQIQAGGDASNVAALTADIHEGRTYAERSERARGLLGERIPEPVIGAILIATLLAARHPIHRWISLLIVFPYSAIWCLWFSYDLRNLALALPFAGLTAAAGTSECFRLCDRVSTRFGRSLIDWTPNLLELKLTVWLLVPAIGLGVLTARISREDLRRRQLELQKSVGVVEVNQQLYEFDHWHPIRREILTDYLPMTWLPELAPRYRFAWSSDLPSWRAAYESTGVGFTLLHKRTTSRAVWSYMDSDSRQGRSQLVFDSKFYRFYKKTELR